VEVHTADMAALPFPDGSSDVVTSAMAIHNIRSPEERYRAVDEAMRVLRTGGQLLIADPWPNCPVRAARRSGAMGHRPRKSGALKPCNEPSNPVMSPAREAGSGWPAREAGGGAGHVSAVGRVAAI
jgi:SAM-dependent methyltransferase